MPTRNLDLVLLWHMHQPDYRDSRSREFTLPWVYLHAIKDYTDMAHHLEAHPRVKAVVNFVPVLLDQIEDYVEQFSMGRLRDPLLRLLAAPDLDRVDRGARRLILESCFRSNHTKMIQPYPHYKRVHELYLRLSQEGETALNYLSGQYLADLLVWYHLAWTGESVRRSSELVVRLMTQGESFSHADRFELFKLIGELMREIIPRYRRLAESGQVELSFSPHHHPLAPLLLDFRSARESQPEAVLPEEPFYPGGRTRVTYHLAAARRSHETRFGSDAAGVWPAEGAVSGPLLDVLAEQGYRWAASGEAVLANSLRQASAAAAGERGQYLYRPYRHETPHGPIALFFRDDKLSDMVGFEYAKWFGKDAALHFVHSLEEIARRPVDGGAPLVSVILDGENAWEYYPYNGYYFLSDLYSALGGHPGIRTTTYLDWLAAHAAPAQLPRLVAGSWVYGTFSTWIGCRDKNHAWDLLAAAKQSFDLVMGSVRLSEEEKAAAEAQLAVCEGSDWFWWFGDYNPEHAVASFDRLYRDNLANLYRLLKLPAPAALAEPISRGGGVPELGGTMRRAS
ncbi:MAG: glycoside hydrolase [Betaproteobacteria bacterium]|nr:glycoside hydrolase [Betaproteobacteria bacterium]